MQLLSRRSFLGAAGGGSLLALAGCGDDEEGPPATATLPPIPEVTPTATQAAIASPVAGYADPERWTGRTLTVASWGGDYEEAQKIAFFEPYAAATGATIQIRTADQAELRSQVDDGNVTWDLLTVPIEEVLDLAHEQILEPIDYIVVDSTPLYDEVVLQYGVGAGFWSTTIVYPAGSSSAPQDWSDFWNVPPIVPDQDPDPVGLRSLKRSPVGTLEFALLADGVPAPELYPLDVDRAFASLDRIRDHVLVWWQESKEPVELIAVGEIGMASAWSVRVEQLGLGDTINTQWYAGMLTADAWVVPRGAPNRDIAMDFVNFATRAIPSANFARVSPYGPVNRDAFEHLRPDRVELLPSAPLNKAVQFRQNWNFWSDNREALTQRFEDWLLAPPPPTATPEVS